MKICRKTECAYFPVPPWRNLIVRTITKFTKDCVAIPFVEVGYSNRNWTPGFNTWQKTCSGLHNGGNQSAPASLNRIRFTSICLHAIRLWGLTDLVVQRLFCWQLNEAYFQGDVTFKIELWLRPYSSSSFITLIANFITEVFVEMFSPNQWQK